MAQHCIWLTNLYPAGYLVFRTPSNCLSSWDATWVDVLALSAFDNRIRMNYVPFLLPLRVNSFTRSTPHRVLTTLGSDPQPEPTPLENHFNQFARIDEGLWAWYFVLRGAQGEGLASVSRAFRGFGREVRWRSRYATELVRMTTSILDLHGHGAIHGILPSTG